LGADQRISPAQLRGRLLRPDLSPRQGRRDPSVAHERLCCFRFWVGLPQLDFGHFSDEMLVRPSRLLPSLRRGHSLTDRDRVDDVPRRTSSPAAAILPSPKKIRMPSPCRQRGSTKGRGHPAGRLRSASGRHDHEHPVWPGPPINLISDVRERCAATAGRGPEGYRGSTGPWQIELLPARGRHPNFFTSTMVAARHGGSPMHGIHPIAIRKSRRWLDGRASDRQAQHTRGYLVERFVKKGPESSSGSGCAAPWGHKTAPDAPRLDLLRRPCRSSALLNSRSASREHCKR
jgi:hypothetical protein